MAEDAEVSSVSDGSNCEMVKKSIIKSTYLNIAVGYLTPKARLPFI